MSFDSWMTYGPWRPVAARDRDAGMAGTDFARAPFTIAWEITRACAFSCVHRRADAQHRRSPQELTTAEGFALIDRFAEFGSPILVFTGGDPMTRVGTCSTSSSTPPGQACAAR